MPVPQTAAGRSLRPIVEGRSAELREVLYGAVYPAFATDGDARPERDVYALYARTPKWKYILFTQDVVESRNGKYFRVQSILTDYPERRRGDQDLYDLESDPHELNNVAAAAEHRGRLEQFKADVLDWWQRTGGKPLDVP